MYTLYYLNANYQLDTIKVDSLDAPILIPEDLIFCNLRKGVNFIKEPHKCIDFTDIERLVMASEFTDMNLLRDNDFRKQNTYLTPLCPIDSEENSKVELYFNGSVLSFKLNSFEHYVTEETYFVLQYVSEAEAQPEEITAYCSFSQAYLDTLDQNLPLELAVHHQTFSEFPNWSKMTGTFHLENSFGDTISNVLTRNGG